MSVPWGKIIEIIILILQLILGGLTESQALEEASLRSGVSLNTVKSVWKHYKK